MSLHSPRNLAARPSEQLVRAVLASLWGEAGLGAHAEKMLAQRFPGDEGSAVILRAATAPASLTSAEWAGVLGSTAVADFIGGLGPVSAAAQIIATSLQVNLGRNSGVLVPTLLPSADVLRFVAAGQPIPVAPLSVGGPVLKPYKIAGIMALTRETLQSTAAEAIVRVMLRESVALSLDAAMFSSLAAIDGERPAGLLNGVSPLAPTAGGGDAAMQTDLVALASAVAGVAGSSITFIASPALALKIALRRAEMPFRVLASATLAAGTIMAVATNALATAVDPQPEIDASKDALVHMETVPQHIGTPDDADADTAPQIAAPARSFWQTDVVGLRLLLGASWQVRAAGAVAVVNSVTW